LCRIRRAGAFEAPQDRGELHRQKLNLPLRQGRSVHGVRSAHLREQVMAPPRVRPSSIFILRLITRANIRAA
jgi:hypothetical protein